MKAILYIGILFLINLLNKLRKKKKKKQKRKQEKVILGKNQMQLCPNSGKSPNAEKRVERVIPAGLVLSIL